MNKYDINKLDRLCSTHISNMPFGSRAVLDSENCIKCDKPAPVNGITLSGDEYVTALQAEVERLQAKYDALRELYCDLQAENTVCTNEQLDTLEREAALVAALYLINTYYTPDPEMQFVFQIVTSALEANAKARDLTSDSATTPDSDLCSECGEHAGFNYYDHRSSTCCGAEPCDVDPDTDMER